MKINCVIIEDEPLALERIKDYVGKISFLNLMAFFDNGIDALGFLKSQKVDLIFLDIQMDGFTGIQLIESLNQRPEIIITTAFDSYALKGFELNVIDYLLKPYTFERFAQAAGRVFDKLNSSLLDTNRTFMFVKTEYRLEKIPFVTILFIEGMRDYRRIHTTEKKIMTSQTFGALEEELPAYNFCRVHKSFIVALDKIESIERDRIRLNNELIPISDTYKDTLMRKIHL